MEDRIRHGRVVSLEGFKDEQEACALLMNGCKTPLSYGEVLPFSYVATNVANEATFCNAECSSNRLRSNVRTSDCRRSAQNLCSILVRDVAEESG
jgi:hypothetical protein